MHAAARQTEIRSKREPPPRAPPPILSTCAWTWLRAWFYMYYRHTHMHEARSDVGNWVTHRFPSPSPAKTTPFCTCNKLTVSSPHRNLFNRTTITWSNLYLSHSKYSRLVDFYGNKINTVHSLNWPYIYFIRFAIWNGSIFPLRYIQKNMKK